MKVRIYKTNSGEVIVDVPVNRYQDKLDECPHPWRFRESNPDKENFEMEIKDVSELEKLIEKNEAGSSQFYYKGKTLKHDNGWNEILMPLDLLKNKLRKRLENKLDEELENENVIESLKLNRKIQKLENLSEEELYKMALENLPPDKTKIKKILEKKLK